MPAGSARARPALALALALACCAGLALAVARAGSPAPAAPELLPDLTPQRPAELTVRSDTRDGRSVHRLGFRSAADNIGPGPLVVRGERDLREPLTMATTQIVMRAGGGRVERPLMAPLRYVTSSDHSHWHYLGFMRYELRDAASGRRVGSDRKTGFCLGDRYETAGGRSAREPRGPVFDTDCAKGRPEQPALREGISVGWGDDYAPHLEGQSIEITDLPAGRYLLVHTVNPDRTLVERTYANNSSTLPVRIVRAPGRPSRVISRARGSGG